MRKKLKTFVKAALLLSGASIVYYYVILNKETDIAGGNKNKHKFLKFEDGDNKVREIGSCSLFAVLDKFLSFVKSVRLMMVNSD